MILKSKWMLAGLLFFITTTGLLAQDKYAFATVFTINIGGKNDGIYIKYSDRKTEHKYIKWDRSGLVQDDSPVLKQLQDMSNEGWEVITIENGQYHLKKKIN